MMAELMQGTATAADFWTLERVARALEDLAHVNLPRGDARLQRVWTDTRSAAPGDLFVALVGERFDAHEFLADAVKGGAAAVLVSRPEATAGLGVPVFQVPDTLAALGALATYRRRAWGGPVIGVVGTNGKTSTKELLRAALESSLDVHATTGNLNNMVGTPLTLLAIPDHADVAVIEMGTNRPGEIARLRAIAEPTIAVVTSIAEEHLEGLGDVAGVLREELSVCDGVAVAVVPASQPEVVQEARSRARRVVAAGLDAGDVRADGFGLESDGAGWIQMEQVRVRVPLRGSHNLRNAMLALGVARELGVDLAAAARGIGTMSGPPMRVAVEHIGRVTVINDAYNANPESTRAALALLAETGRDRQRVAVLGTMLEMGEHTARLHEEIAREALGGTTSVLAAIGEFATAFGRLAPGDPRVETAADVLDVWPALSSRLEPDAIILLKGSRGVRLERLLDSIREWATSAAS